MAGELTEAWVEEARAIAGTSGSGLSSTPGSG
jgi:hypothetical protein